MSDIMEELHAIYHSIWVDTDRMIVENENLQRPYGKHLYDDFVMSQLKRYDETTKYMLMSNFFSEYGDKICERHNKIYHLFLEVVNKSRSKLLPKTILSRMQQLRFSNKDTYEPPKRQVSTVPKVILQTQTTQDILRDRYRASIINDEEIRTKLRDFIKDNPRKAQKTTIYNIIDHITNNDLRKYRNDNDDQFIIAGHSFSDWYSIYLDLRDSMNEIIINKVSQVNGNVDTVQSNLLYPFKSKISDYNKLNSENVILKPQTTDYKLKPANKLALPSFSYIRGCWEMDFAFSSKNKTSIPMYKGLYLVMINVNTKYAVFFKCNDKSESSVMRALKDLIDKFPVNHLRGDGEKSFASDLMKRFYEKHNITTYFNNSKFTLHNKIIDRVIRTIRDGLQVNVNFENDVLVQKVVDYYNNTPHTAFRKIFNIKPLPSPYEMMGNEFLEYIYINYKSEQANKIFALRAIKGLVFQPNDRVICHIDFSKTDLGFMKKRKIFEFTGTFIDYINSANGIVELDNEFETSKGKIIKTITLPIMYIKHLR